MIHTSLNNKVYVSQTGKVTAIKYPDHCVRLFHHDENGHVDKLFEIRWQMQQALCALYLRDNEGRWLVGWDHPDKESIYEFKETEITNLDVTAEGLVKVHYNNGTILRGTSYALQ